MTGQGVKPGLLLLSMLLEGGEDLSHLWGELRSAAATYLMVTTGPLLRNATSQDSLGLWRESGASLRTLLNTRLMSCPPVNSQVPSGLQAGPADPGMAFQGASSSKSPLPHGRA